jgi:hypothetical protein
MVEEEKITTLLRINFKTRSSPAYNPIVFKHGSILKFNINGRVRYPHFFMAEYLLRSINFNESLMENRKNYLL